MYEEVVVKRRIDWKSLLIKCGILCLVVFIICALIIAPRTSYASVPLNNVSKKMLKAGKKYYDNDKLPTKVGRASKITLNELIEKEYLSKKTYKNCNLQNSYVKVTKVGDKEFSIYAYLQCEEDENTVVDTIKTLVDNQKKENIKVDEQITNQMADDNFVIEVIE